VLKFLSFLFLISPVCFAGWPANYTPLEEVSGVLDKTRLELPRFTEVLPYGEVKTVEKTLELRLLRLTNPDSKKAKKNILITAATHGDELISTEVVLGWLDHFTEAAKKSEKWTQDILDNYEVDVIVVVNPVGYAARTRNEGAWDPNRSYPPSFHLQEEVHSTPSIEAIRDLYEQRKYFASLDFHAYGEWLLYPWTDTKNPLPPEDYNAYQILGSAMQKASGYTLGQGSRLMYMSIGGSIDWYYAAFKSYAFCIEVGKAFAPVDKAPDVEKGKAILAAFFETLPKLPALKGTAHPGLSKQDLNVVVGRELFMNMANQQQASGSPGKLIEEVLSMATKVSTQVFMEPRNEMIRNINRGWLDVGVVSGFEMTALGHENGFKGIEPILVASNEGTITNDCVVIDRKDTEKPQVLWVYKKLTTSCRKHLEYLLQKKFTYGIEVKNSDLGADTLLDNIGDGKGAVLINDTQWKTYAQRKPGRAGNIVELYRNNIPFLGDGWFLAKTQKPLVQKFIWGLKSKEILLKQARMMLFGVSEFLTPTDLWKKIASEIPKEVFEY